MKILEHVGFKSEDEQSIENSIKMGKQFLGQMKYEEVNEVLVQKGSKARGGPQCQQTPTKKQASPSNLQDFDNEIRRTPLIEALLNNIINNQQAYEIFLSGIYAKVDYLIRKLTNTRMPFPTGFFYDGDDT